MHGEYLSKRPMISFEIIYKMISFALEIIMLTPSIALTVFNLYGHLNINEKTRTALGL